MKHASCKHGPKLGELVCCLALGTATSSRPCSTICAVEQIVAAVGRWRLARAGETRAVVDGGMDDEGAAVMVGEGGGRGLESCKVCDADDVIVDVKSLL